MRPDPRPELAALVPVVHGGNAAPGIADFSTGVSPLPVPPQILAAARDADVTRYPSPTGDPFRCAVAALHGVAPASVVAGAGAVELIWALARAFAGAGRTGLVVTPAFGEYERALRVSGAAVITAETTPPRFALAMPALERAFAARPVALAFLCRPSNPCLVACPSDLIAQAARRWPGTLFVVDEAYLPMFDDLDAVAPRENVAVLRSLTKVFALPGLRLGYLLAHPDVARVVQAALPPWNVSAPAQAAGMVAAGLLPSAAPAIRLEIRTLRDSLQRDLYHRDARLTPQTAGGPFLLYKVPDAESLCRQLLDARILVRHAASFGLPDHIRIGVRGTAEQQRLLDAWPVSSPG